MLEKTEITKLKIEDLKPHSKNPKIIIPIKGI
jgi:hypothetical protein